MRLFRRRSNDAPKTDAQAPAAVASTDEADVARPERQATGDWMTAGPMPMAATSRMPTTFRVQTLPDILTSHHDTRLSGSLGHAVSAEAPSGSVQGLASSVGTVSATIGHGTLPLREPAHQEHAPEAEPAMVRRLATTDTAAAVAVPETASLPEPPVSRVLANPAPMTARAAGDRPLPVARVVDAPAPSASPPSVPTATPAMPASSSPAAPLVGDDRVGGFEVPLDELLTTTGEQPDHIQTSPPAELAPPIQPRRVQRRVDASAPSLPAMRPSDPPAMSSETASAPLVGESSPASAGDAPSTASASDAAPIVSPAMPLVSPAAPSDDPNADPPVAPLADAPAASTPVDLPVERLADAPAASASTPAGAGDSAASAPLLGEAGLTADASADGDDAAEGATPTASSGAGGPADLVLQRPPHAGADPEPAAPDLAPPIQRLADASSSPATTSTTTTPATAAPLFGADTPVVADNSPTLGSQAGDAPSSGSAVEGPSTDALPLVGPAGRAAAPASTSKSDDTPQSSETSETSEPDDVPVQPTAPTLGTDTSLVHVQPLSESGLASSSTGAPSSTSSLPLAPPEQAASLQPPAARDSGPTASLSAAAQPSPGETSGSTVRTLAAAAPTSMIGAAPSLQREVSALGAASSESSAPSGLAGGGAQTVRPPLPFVRPLTAVASSVQRTADGATGGPHASPVHAGIATLSPLATSHVPAAAPPVLLRRLVSPDATGDGLASISTIGGHSRHAEAGAPLQRLDASASSPSSLSSGAVSNGSLPLHTPAASVPSAADVAVKAGLAERAPDGSLFYTSPPGESLDVQRSIDAAAPSVGSQHIQASASGSAAELQRPASPNGPQARALSASAGGGAAAEGAGPDTAAQAKDLAEEAKKLYPYIRSALESDLRRQLEGKSRASRFRP